MRVIKADTRSLDYSSFNGTRQLAVSEWPLVWGLEGFRVLGLSYKGVLSTPCCSPFLGFYRQKEDNFSSELWRILLQFRST